MIFGHEVLVHAMIFVATDLVVVAVVALVVVSFADRGLILGGRGAVLVVSLAGGLILGRV